MVATPIERRAAPRTAMAVALFVGLWALFLWYPHGGFAGLIPDNITQTAYWRLLTHRELAGGIGSAAPKGGLIALLGGAYWLAFDVAQAPIVYKAVFATFAAATAWLVCLIAVQIGGMAGGALALVLALGSGYLGEIYFFGTSNIFFVPITLAGLWLLSRGHVHAGVIAQCVALTVRLEGLAVAASVIVQQARAKRRLRVLLELCLYVSVALTFHVIIAYLVQGSWERINAGQPTGYPAPESLDDFAHVRGTLARLLAEPAVATVLMPAALAVAAHPASRVYLHYFALLVLLALIALLHPSLGFEFRYIASVQLVLVALGCGGVGAAFARPEETLAWLVAPERRVRCAIVAGLLVAMNQLASGRWHTTAATLAVPAIFFLAAVGARATTRRALLTAALTVVLVSFTVLFATLAHRQLRAYAAIIEQGRWHAPVLDGRDLLASDAVPRGESVIMDDEMLAYLIAVEPGYFSRVQSAQYFNIVPAGRREALLRAARYLYLSKRENRGWNYLYMIRDRAWLDDPFRHAVEHMLSSGQPVEIYGVRLTPMRHTNNDFVARIGPAGGNPTATGAR